MEWTTVKRRANEYLTYGLTVGLLAAPAVGQYSRYESQVPVTQHEEHYFPGGAVAFTDLRTACRKRDERMPYRGIEFAEHHERKHIEFGRQGREQNEPLINRKVRYEMGLDSNPFPSYDESNLY